MNPPWLMYPTLSRYNLKWKSEEQKAYLTKFLNWFNSLSELEQQKYKQMFVPPRQWIDYYDNYDDDFNEHDSFYMYDLWSNNKNHKLKYSIAKLQNDFKSKKKLDYLAFWGHRESKTSAITQSCLSQWWISEFKIDEVGYCCMEQYMMAEKARLFKDNEIENQILICKEPNKIKALGRKVKNFNEKLWDKYKYFIVLNGNYAKFTQNKRLMNFLLATKSKILIEASPYDKIWGIGMSSTNEYIANPLKWNGQNLLGLALMEVRDEILEVYKNYDNANNQI